MVKLFNTVNFQLYCGVVNLAGKIQNDTHRGNLQEIENIFYDIDNHIILPHVFVLWAKFMLRVWLLHLFKCVFVCVSVCVLVYVCVWVYALVCVCVNEFVLASCKEHHLIKDYYCIICNEHLNGRVTSFSASQFVGNRFIEYESIF